MSHSLLCAAVRLNMNGGASASVPLRLSRVFNDPSTAARSTSTVRLQWGRGWDAFSRLARTACEYGEPVVAFACSVRQCARR